MALDSLSFMGNTASQFKPASDAVERERKGPSLVENEPVDEKKVQPEEVLTKIKALTEDGAYSVRFEKNDADGQMIVRLVDVNSGEVIRQLPPEEMLNLSEKLQSLRGNLVDKTW